MWSDLALPPPPPPPSRSNDGSLSLVSCLSGGGYIFVLVLRWTRSSSIYILCSKNHEKLLFINEILTFRTAMFLTAFIGLKRINHQCKSIKR